jgi:predicted dehydrogenase
MVAQVKRFSPQAQYLKQLIESGAMGAPYYGRAYWLRRYGIPGFGTWFTAKQQSGGGPLIDIGVHMLDVAWWLMGCPRPTAAMGATYAQFGPRGKGLGKGSTRNDDKNAPFDVEDLAVGLIRFEDGQTINVEVSWAIHTERDSQGVEIFGPDAGCEWGDTVRIHTDRNGEAHSEMIEVGFGDMWQNQMQHFIDCILQDTLPDPDATQGATLMKMLDAIYQSAQSGRETLID